MKLKRPLISGFPLVEGAWGNPPTSRKIGLPPPPPLLCPKNVDFVIFMQFLANLPKMSPTSRTQLQNPELCSDKKFKNFESNHEQKNIGGNVYNKAKLNSQM